MINGPWACAGEVCPVLIVICVVGRLGPRQRRPPPPPRKQRKQRKQRSLGECASIGPRGREGRAAANQSPSRRLHAELAETDHPSSGSSPVGPVVALLFIAVHVPGRRAAASSRGRSRPRSRTTRATQALVSGCTWLRTFQHP